MRWKLRILKQVATLFTVKLPVQLIGIPVVALELLLHLKDKRVENCVDQRLICKWFDNGDDLDREYGLNGDKGYQLSRGNPTDTWGIYRMRFNWLALRNPINYFQYNVLGSRVEDLGNIESYHNYIDGVGESGDLEVGDWQYAGVRKIELDSGEWEHYTVYRYPFKPEKCFRARIGHKLGHNPIKHKRSGVQWVCAIQPWKDYRGK